MRRHLWRVTRNRYGRAIYDWLADRGVRASAMVEYRREVRPVPVEAPGTVVVEERAPGALRGTDRDAAVLERADVVIEARTGAERCGSALLTLERPVPVPELGRKFDPGGGYIWRVHVDPAERNRGIGGALIGAAVRATASRNVAEAVALVARDNVPSRRAFTGAGFSSEVEHRYLRLRDWELSRSSRR